MANVSKADIVFEPFPHLVIKDCLNKEVYDLLSQRYPDLDSLPTYDGAKGDENIRVKRITDDIINCPNIPLDKKWIEFFDYHCSKDFWIELVNIFEDQLREIYPDLEKRFKKSYKDLSVSVFQRHKDNDNANLYFDHDIGVNTTSTKKSSVRGPHIDNLHKIFGGLIYFRIDEDSTQGGDLDLYAWKGDRNFNAENIYYDINTEYLQKIKTIQYSQNTAVLWINSPDAVHGVSPREPSSHLRRLIYFSARINPKVAKKNLFPELIPSKPNILKKLAKKVKRMIR